MLNPLKIVIKKENPKTIQYHPIAPKIEAIKEQITEEQLLTEPTFTNPEVSERNFLQNVDASKISKEEQTILIENGGDDNY